MAVTSSTLVEGVAREEEGTRPRRAASLKAAPGGSRSWPQLRSSARRASAVFGSEAEVLPAGQATTPHHSLPGLHPRMRMPPASSRRPCSEYTGRVLRRRSRSVTDEAGREEAGARQRRRHPDRAVSHRSLRRRRAGARRGPGRCEERHGDGEPRPCVLDPRRTGHHSPRLRASWLRSRASCSGAVRRAQLVDVLVLEDRSAIDGVLKPFELRLQVLAPELRASPSGAPSRPLATGRLDRRPPLRPRHSRLTRCVIVTTIGSTDRGLRAPSPVRCFSTARTSQPSGRRRASGKRERDPTSESAGQPRGSRSWAQAPRLGATARR